MKFTRQSIMGMLSGITVAVIGGAAVVGLIYLIVHLVNRSKDSGAVRNSVPVDNRPIHEKMITTWTNMDVPLTLKHLAMASVEVLRQADRDPAFFVTAGDLAAERFDYPSAIAYYRKALHLSPDDLEAQKGLANAMMLLRAHCVERIILAQDFLIPGDPSSAMEMLLSDFYLSKLDSQLLELHKQIVRLAKGDRTAKFNLAVTLMNMQMFDEAEKAYKEMIEEDPKDVKSLFNLATIYQIQCRLGEARDTLKKVIAIDAGLPAAYASLGAVYMDFKQPENAMQAYAEATKLDDKSAALWGNFAIAASQAGSMGRAIFAAKKSLELDPTDAGMCRRLGDIFLTIYREKNDAEILVSAVQAWQRSLQIKPDQADVRELVKMYSSPGAGNKTLTRPK